MTPEQLAEIEKVCQLAFHYHARRAADRRFWADQLETIKRIKEQLRAVDC
ncbi:hypothetical protein EVB67_062 [Rhizobium phage RHph_TM3_3_14B]|nr:hypothetical protein EVB67_062 [Rhizobium phage RHph_TM3_3_14B]